MADAKPVIAGPAPKPAAPPAPADAKLPPPKRPNSRSPSRSRSRSRSPRSRSPSRSPRRGRSPLSPRRRSPTPPPTSLYVNKLTRNVKKEHVAEIFGTYGKVDNVELVINRQTLLPRGFAYVHFAKREEAELALAEMNGGQIDGQMLVVEWLKQPRRRSPPRRPARRCTLSLFDFYSSVVQTPRRGDRLEGSSFSDLVLTTQTLATPS